MTVTRRKKKSNNRSRTTTAPATAPHAADSSILIAPRGLLFRYMTVRTVVETIRDLYCEGEGGNSSDAYRQEKKKEKQDGRDGGRTLAFLNDRSTEANARRTNSSTSGQQQQQQLLPWFQGRFVRSLALLNNGVENLSDLRCVLHDLPPRFASKLTSLFVVENGGVEKTRLFRVLVINTFPGLTNLNGQSVTPACERLSFCFIFLCVIRPFHQTFFLCVLVDLGDNNNNNIM